MRLESPASGAAAGFNAVPGAGQNWLVSQVVGSRSNRGCNLTWLLAHFKAINRQTRVADC
jgi:hypothetical protein